MNTKHFTDGDKARLLLDGAKQAYPGATETDLAKRTPTGTALRAAVTSAARALFAKSGDETWLEAAKQIADGAGAEAKPVGQFSHK